MASQIVLPDSLNNSPEGRDTREILLASFSGEMDKLREILERNPNAARYEFWYTTPIYLAVCEGHLEATKLLWQAVRPADISGLIDAAEDRGFEEIISFLKESRGTEIGPNENLKDVFDNLDALELAPLEELNLPDSQGRTMLHHAVLARNVDAIHRLISAGVAVDSVDDIGFRPIHLAYWKTQLWNSNDDAGSIAEMLLQAGARDCISLAAARGDLVALERFLETDSKLVNDGEGLEKRPLSAAAERGHAEIVNGSLIAFTGTEGEGNSWLNTHLWVVAADGTTAPRNLTDSLDFFIGNATLSDVASGISMPPVWSSSGRRIYVQISHHGNTTLHTVSVGENGPDLESVIDSKGVVCAFSIDADQSRLAYLHVDWSNPGQIRVLSLEDGIDQPVTAVNEDLLAEVNLGDVEEVWYKGKDDNELQGWIVRPSGFDATKSYPAIVEIHGGPLSQYGNVFFHEFHYLSGQGYLVCLSNPRGGRGYGEDHAHAAWNDAGGKDYDDLMSWTDYIEQLPYVDSERTGVTGGSYGGLMVNFIIGRSQRFSAAVSQRSVFERVSVYASDMNWTRNFMFGGVYPWEDFEPYWRQSPLREIGNVKTPTLVINSENDLRCPIYQGEQLFVALKVLGVDTEMIRFPDESHGLSRGGRTDRRVARLEHILRWFDRYLKPAT